MRSSRVVRASDSQWRSRNCPGFDLSILRNSGIWGAADEAVLNIVEKIQKSPLKERERERETLKVQDILRFSCRQQAKGDQALKSPKKLGKEGWICLIIQPKEVPEISKEILFNEDPDSWLAPSFLRCFPPDPILKKVFCFLGNKRN